MAADRPTIRPPRLPAGYGDARLTRSVWSGVLIGVGIAAFVDETVFHQLLHWHHFYDKSTPSVGLVSDGLFHAFGWFAVVIGLVMVADLRRRAGLAGRGLCGGILLGAGFFQLYDGTVQHKLMGLHQIRYQVNTAPYDWTWNIVAVVLLALGFIAFWVIVDKLGGLTAAMTRLAGDHPDMLIRGEHIKPLKLLTYTCIPLSVGMFPHMFIHWLTAKSASSFKPTIAFYPVCIAIVWVPSVLLGVLAHLDFPNLGVGAANSVLVKMIDQHAPGVLAGLLAAGVFAAIMNSFDSQVHSVGTMFTQDIVRHYGFHDRMSESKQILVGRLFMMAILVATYLLSRVVDRKSVV